MVVISSKSFRIVMKYLRTCKGITLPLNILFHMHLLENRIFNSQAIMSNEHAYFCHEMYYVASTSFFQNFCGRHFGWYYALWLILGFFVVNILKPYWQLWRVKNCNIKGKWLVWKIVKLAIILCAVIAAAPRRGNWRTDAVAPPRKYCQLMGSM